MKSKLQKGEVYLTDKPLIIYQHMKTLLKSSFIIPFIVAEFV